MSDNLIHVIEHMISVFPEDSKYKEEVNILMRKVIQMFVVSNLNSATLYDYHTCIESLQECSEIIDETLDVISNPVEMNLQEESQFETCEIDEFFNCTQHRSNN